MAGITNESFFTEVISNITDLAPLEIDTADIAVAAYRSVKEKCYGMVMPAILGFGICGNIINIIILCQQRFHGKMDKMERCTTMGFTFLAASDLGFCLFAFPSAFLQNTFYAKTSSPLEVMKFLYMNYRPGILNTFLISSSWCVVVIAIERYLVVRYPLKAGSAVRLRRTIILQVVIPVASLMLNIPHFVKYSIDYATLSDNSTIMVLGITPFKNSVVLRNIYIVMWNTIGTILPAIILIFCNINLIAEIYKSKSLGLVNANKYSTSRITLILIFIIIMYIILVCPSAFLNFIQEVYFMSEEKASSYKFLTATVITNVLQSLNFAINFILYFGMHPKFRSNLSCCAGCKKVADVKKRFFEQHELANMAKVKYEDGQYRVYV